jgi:cytochrome P460
LQSSSINFPQGTVTDGLPSVVTTGNSTRIRFPRPGETSPEPTRSRKEDPNHAVTLGVAYVNDAGRDGFQRKPFAFPVGTMIVRETLLPSSATAERLVVMIKREKSFNRKANGWEFLTINGEGTRILKREKSGKCLGCHQSATASDFVFPEEKR